MHKMTEVHGGGGLLRPNETTKLSLGKLEKKVSGRYRESGEDPSGNLDS